MTARATSTSRTLFFAATTCVLTVTRTALGADTCVVHSAETVPPVVELYTSEGCSSCPPADRWLTSLKSDSGIVALAFHVDYWDRLGWRDRFASPFYSRRQSEEQAHNGAEFSYTPQVVVDGADQKDWRTKSPSNRQRPAANVTVAVTRNDETYVAVVTSKDGAPDYLDAYWAVTEDGHESRVNAGENRGATLHHDSVVREYLAIKSWNTKVLNEVKLSFTPRTAIDPAHSRHINLIVRDARTGRPVQAVKASC